MGPRREGPVGPVVLMPGKLHGVRTWALSPDRSGTIRLGGYAGRHWRQAGETTWAECERWGGQTPRLHTAPAPHGRCFCGLYALHPWAIDRIPFWRSLSPWQLSPWQSQYWVGGLGIVGIVEAWGRVHVHAEGFRAQYARPVVLALIGMPRRSEYGKIAAELAVSHRAELLEFGSFELLVDYCHGAGIGMRGSVVRKLLRRS